MARPVERWLETFMCGQYAETFEAYGYKTLQLVCQLSPHQLQVMGVLPDHCEKIMENVSVLRQSYMGGMGGFGDGGGGGAYMNNQMGGMNYQQQNNPQMSGGMPPTMGPYQGQGYYGHGQGQGPGSMWSHNQPPQMGQYGSAAYMAQGGPMQHGGMPAHHAYGHPQYGPGPGPGPGGYGGQHAAPYGSSSSMGAMGGGGPGPGGMYPGNMPPQHPSGQGNPAMHHHMRQQMQQQAQQQQQAHQQQQAQQQQQQAAQQQQQAAQQQQQAAQQQQQAAQQQQQPQQAQQQTQQQQPNPQQAQQQSPQQVADSILQMASSSYTGSGPMSQMSGPQPPSMGTKYPGQQVQGQMGTMPPQHSPHMMQNSPGQFPNQYPQGQVGHSASQMGGGQMGPDHQFMYPNTSQLSAASQPSPMSPMQVRSPASVHSNHSLPSTSPGPMRSPAPNAERSPATHSVSSPGLANMRSPGMQPMASPMNCNQPMRSPMHSMHHPTPSPLPQMGPGGQPSPASVASSMRSPSNQGPQGHFSPNTSYMNSNSTHSSPSYSTCSQPSSTHATLTNSSMYTEGGGNQSGMTYSMAGSHQHQFQQQQQHQQAQHQLQQQQMESDDKDSDFNPLQSLQKLVMLPESQVIDPKSVVNDACLPNSGESKNYEPAKNGEPPPEVYSEFKKSSQQHCSDGQHCGNADSEMVVLKSPVQKECANTTATEPLPSGTEVNTHKGAVNKENTATKPESLQTLPQPKPPVKVQRAARTKASARAKLQEAMAASAEAEAARKREQEAAAAALAAVGEPEPKKPRRGSSPGKSPSKSEKKADLSKQSFQDSKAKVGNKRKNGNNNAALQVAADDQADVKLTNGPEVKAQHLKKNKPPGLIDKADILTPNQEVPAEPTSENGTVINGVNPSEDHVIPPKELSTPDKKTKKKKSLTKRTASSRKANTIESQVDQASDNTDIDSSKVESAGNIEKESVSMVDSDMKSSNCDPNMKSESAKPAEKEHSECKVTASTNLVELSADVSNCKSDNVLVGSDKELSIPNALSKSDSTNSSKDNTDRGSDVTDEKPKASTKDKSDIEPTAREKVDSVESGQVASMKPKADDKAVVSDKSERQESQGNTEEKPKKTEEKPKKTEEKPKKTEEKPKKTEEKLKETEEKPKKTEEKSKETEEKQNKTEEKQNKAVAGDEELSKVSVSPEKVKTLVEKEISIVSLTPEKVKTPVDKELSKVSVSPQKVKLSSDKEPSKVSVSPQKEKTPEKKQSLNQIKTTRKSPENVHAVVPEPIVKSCEKPNKDITKDTEKEETIKTDSKLSDAKAVDMKGECPEKVDRKSDTLNKKSPTLTVEHPEVKPKKSKAVDAIGDSPDKVDKNTDSLNEKSSLLRVEPLEGKPKKLKAVDTKGESPEKVDKNSDSLNKISPFLTVEPSKGKPKESETMPEVTTPKETVPPVTSTTVVSPPPSVKPIKRPPSPAAKAKSLPTAKSAKSSPPVAKCAKSLPPPLSSPTKVPQSQRVKSPPPQTQPPKIVPPPGQVSTKVAVLQQADQKTKPVDQRSCKNSDSKVNVNPKRELGKSLQSALRNIKKKIELQEAKGSQSNGPGHCNGPVVPKPMAKSDSVVKQDSFPAKDLALPLGNEAIEKKDIKVKDHVDEVKPPRDVTAKHSVLSSPDKENDSNNKLLKKGAEIKAMTPSNQVTDLPVLEPKQAKDTTLLGPSPPKKEEGNASLKLLEKDMWGSTCSVKLDPIDRKLHINSPTSLLSDPKSIRKIEELKAKASVSGAKPSAEPKAMPIDLSTSATNSKLESKAKLDAALAAHSTTPVTDTIEKPANLAASLGLSRKIKSKGRGSKLEMIALSLKTGAKCADLKSQKPLLSPTGNANTNTSSQPEQKPKQSLDIRNADSVMQNSTACLSNPSSVSGKGGPEPKITSRSIESSANGADGKETNHLVSTTVLPKPETTVHKKSEVSNSQKRDDIQAREPAPVDRINIEKGDSLPPSGDSSPGTDKGYNTDNNPKDDTSDTKPDFADLSIPKICSIVSKPLAALTKPECPKLLFEGNVCKSLDKVEEPEISRCDEPDQGLRKGGRKRRQTHLANFVDMPIEINSEESDDGDYIVPVKNNKKIKKEIETVVMTAQIKNENPRLPIRPPLRPTGRGRGSRGRGNRGVAPSPRAPAAGRGRGTSPATPAKSTADSPKSPIRTKTPSNLKQEQPAEPPAPATPEATTVTPGSRPHSATTPTSSPVKAECDTPQAGPSQVPSTSSDGHQESPDQDQSKLSSTQSAQELSDSAKKKRGRPYGSKNKVPIKRNKKKGGGSREGLIDFSREENDLKAMLKRTGEGSTVSSKKKKAESTRGPFVRVTGPRDNLDSCEVFNSTDWWESEKTSKEKKGHKDKGSSSVAAQTTFVMSDSVPWLCAFCGNSSNHETLGDLFGPYYPENYTPTPSSKEGRLTESPSVSGLSPGQRKRKRKLSTSPGNEDVTAAGGSGTNRRRRKSRESGAGSTLGSPRHESISEDLPPEIWVHEECAIWSHGVYLADGKVNGLEEAIGHAKQQVCSQCRQVGANLGCYSKGCSLKFHYLCATLRECLLDEENFTLMCPKHKEKKVKMMTSSSSVS